MSQDSFDQKKRRILQEIGQTLDQNVPDLSPKGSIDELCVPIMNLINSNNDMVTTSSCSGRVSVFLEGSKVKAGDSIKIGGKGEGGRWLFVTHNSNELSGWYKAQLFKYNSILLHHTPATRYILYKFEPLILHVKCRNLEMASKLYTTAMSCGFRETGIGVNYIVAIRISIKLDVPIGYYDEENDELRLFVDTNYLDMLEAQSLGRFRENEKKLGQLFQGIVKLLEDGNRVPKSVETKEQRRERKIKEGLEKKRLKQIELELQQQT